MCSYDGFEYAYTILVYRYGTKGKGELSTGTAIPPRAGELTGSTATVTT